MCIAGILIHQHPDYPIMIASNRDEYVSRPTLAMHAWNDEAGIVAGKDLQEGGTWLGVNAKGRIALVTNFRDPFERVPSARSRGEIVVNALRSEAGASEVLAALAARRRQYRSFNFVLIDEGQAYVFESRTGTQHLLGAGIHVVSNGPFGAPWDKCIRFRDALARAASAWDGDPVIALARVLDDHTRSAGDRLPDTGVEREVEHALSAIRVTGLPGYATRTRSIIVQSDTKTHLSVREHWPTIDRPAGWAQQFVVPKEHSCVAPAPNEASGRRAPSGGCQPGAGLSSTRVLGH